jgi:hypothetical protein
LRFYEIIASFSGIANVSGNSVYGQNIYLFDHVNIGYTFANVLTRTPDRKLIVDSELLNDVREQAGGGAEPLHVGKEERNIIVGATAQLVGTTIDVAGGAAGRTAQVVGTTAGDARAAVTDRVGAAAKTVGIPDAAGTKKVTFRPEHD